MGYEIEVTDEFRDWWDELTPEQQEDLADVIDLLEERGPTLGRPWADRIAGSRIHNLKELRCRSDETHLRVLFVFDPRRVAILLLGGDKAGTWSAWYPPAIREAESLYEEYLEELRSESLLEDDP